MKKLLLLLLLIPSVTFARLDDISCDDAKNLIKGTTYTYRMDNPNWTYTLYTDTESFFVSTDYLWDSFMCSVEWRKYTQDMKVWAFQEILYKNQKWDWVSYANSLISKAHFLQETNKPIAPTWSESTWAIRTISNSTEWEDSVRQARIQIESKSIMDTWSTNTWTIAPIKPLTLKEKRLLKLEKLKQKRLELLAKRKALHK